MRIQTISEKGIHSFVYKLNKPIRNFYLGLRNIAVWIPTLWKDRPWDSYYLYVLIKKKLEGMSCYEKEYAIAKKAPAVARDMDHAIALIDWLLSCDSNQDDTSNQQALQALGANSKQTVQNELFDLLKTHVSDWWD